MNPAVRGAIALMFAVVLLMQGFALAPPCIEGGAAAAPAATSSHAATAAHDHCSHGRTGAHTGCGGSCCLVALAIAVAHWTAPAPVTARIATAGLRVPPGVAPDRLDRPPRLRPA